MKKVLIPTKLDKVVAKILTDAGFEVVQVPDKPILDLAKENADAQVVIVRSEKVTPEVMDQLPQLKLVVRAGAGYDNIDIVEYLSKDDSGKIRRGTWHTVEVLPDTMSRIVGAVFSQTFCNSRGGGDY